MPKLQLPPTTMHYPLREKIGAPHLFVGREREMKDFHKCVADMPCLLSQSRSLLRRRKSGKADFFTDATDDRLLNTVDVQTRVILRCLDGGKQEVDIVAQSNDNRVILIEVKNQQERPSEVEVATFLEKIALYGASYPDQTMLPVWHCPRMPASPPP